MDDLPNWSDTEYAAADLVNLRAIEGLPGAPTAAALRSYATGRREHWLYGPMPAAVCRAANRRLWLRRDAERWLTCPLPPWRRSRQHVAAWAAQGRPRPSVP